MEPKSIDMLVLEIASIDASFFMHCGKKVVFKTLKK